MVANQGSKRGQHALRSALLVGDERQIQQILSRPVPNSWIQYIWSCYFTSSVTLQLDVSRLQLVYEDDLATPAAMYLASGCLMATGSPGGAEGQGGRWYSTTSAARAAVLKWLVQQEGLDIDCTSVNLNCHNLLHACTLGSGSPEALQQLLSHFQAAAPDGALQQALDAEDVRGRRPLDLALQQQQWQCAASLIAAGGLLGYRPYLSQVVRVTDMLTPPTGPSTFPLGVESKSLAWNLFGGVLSTLPFGLGSGLGAVLGMGDRQQQLAEAGGRLEGAGGSCGEAGAEGAVTALELQQVAERMRWSVQQVSHVLGVSESAAAALLAANGFDVDHTVAGQLGGGVEEGIAAAAANGQAVATGQAAESPTGQAMTATCIVCFEEVHTHPPAAAAAAGAGSGCSSSSSSSRAASGDAIELGCGHITCTTCWRGILKARLDEGDVHRAVCPHPGCGLPLPAEAARTLLTDADHRRYEALMAQHYVDNDARMKWCPRPGCGKAVRLDGGVGAGGAAGGGRDVICGCGWGFCWSCLEAPHEPALCKQAAAWKDMEAEVKQQAAQDTSKWLQRHTAACPSCGTRIQRDGGCNHMTCRVCQSHFCWVCGGPWSEHSAATGGYYNCNRHAPPGSYPPDPTQAPSPLSAPPSIPPSLLTSISSAVTSAVATYRKNQTFRRISTHSLDLPHLTTLLNHIQTLHNLLLPPPITPPPPSPRPIPSQPTSAPHPTSSSTPSQPQTSPPPTTSKLQPPCPISEPPATSAPPPTSAPSTVPAPTTSAPPAEPTTTTTSPIPAQPTSAQPHPSPATPPTPCSRALPPLPHTPDPLWARWREALSRGSRALHWSLVMGYYLPPSTGLRYLEHVQDQLAASLERLAAAARNLPHAPAILQASSEATADATLRLPTARQAAAYAACMGLTLVQWVSALCCSSWGGGGGLGGTGGGSFLGRRGGREKEGWVEGLGREQAVEQAAYVMALAANADRVQALVESVERYTAMLLEGGRQGLFSSGPQAARGGGVRPLGAVEEVRGGGGLPSTVQGVGEAVVYGIRKMLGV